MPHFPPFDIWSQMGPCVQTMDLWNIIPEETPDFVSMGMVVIDEIRFPGKRPLYDIPGGSGLYATFGARLLRDGSGDFLGPVRPQRIPPSYYVACLVRKGYDFPETVSSLLKKWRLHFWPFYLKDKPPCTRGLLVYEDDVFGRKTFTYTTPPLEPRPHQLQDNNILRARSFHFLCLPMDLELQVEELIRMRKKNKLNPRTLIVWEPAPSGCDRHRLDDHLRSCKYADVFSPNHLELCYLVEGKKETDPTFDKATIEKYAMKFLLSGIGQNGRGLIVVRAGEHGVLTLTSSGPEWLPAYYDKPSPKVVDPTGAGNAFLGAFSLKLQETDDPREAAICGSVAASFALEQIGPPVLTSEPKDPEETWNGVTAASRLDEYRKRVAIDSENESGERCLEEPPPMYSWE